MRAEGFGPKHGLPPLAPLFELKSLTSNQTKQSKNKSQKRSKISSIWASNKAYCKERNETSGEARRVAWLQSQFSTRGFLFSPESANMNECICGNRTEPTHQQVVNRIIEDYTLYLTTSLPSVVGWHYISIRTNKSVRKTLFLLLTRFIASPRLHESRGLAVVFC